jgi:hypothetical protein
VIGRAIVTAAAKRLAKPLVFAARDFPYLVELRIESLGPLRDGVELAPLVPRLGATVPDTETWSVRMRRALVPLAASDARLIERELSRIALPYSDARGSYALSREAAGTRARR